MADEESSGGTGTQTYHLAKVKKRSKSSKLITAKSPADGSIALYHKELSDPLPGQRSTKALAEVVSKAGYELAGEVFNVLRGDRRSYSLS